MQTLDNDVLRHVVTYFSPEDLDRINGANPVFFDAWMASRYESLSFTRRDKETKRLLAHLCDPRVALYVERVAIQPWLVQPHSKTRRSVTENVWIRFSELLDPDYTQKQAAKRLQKRLRQDVVSVTDAFNAMRNIREYHIDWDETRPYHPEHYQAFLTPVLEKWTDLLVKLTIKVPPQILKSLAKVHLRKLEILEYHFSTGMMAFKDIDDAHDGFLVFVNNLRDSLQAISFSSTHTSQNLDMSRIYRLLGTFPKLNSVSLSIPFDGGHLCDPKTLIRFLEKHRSTLKNLNLFTSRCTVHVTPSDPECILWIQHILASVHTPFPQFRGLGIALRPLRAPLDALYRFLSMHSSTLHSLILTDRKLGCHELWKTVSETVDLRHLRLKLDGLCPELLFDLASSLPGLQSLRIECSKLHVHSRSRTRIWEDDKKNFREEMIRNKPRVERWGLQLMAIGPAEFHLARDLERALVECMPNLTVSDLVVQ